MNSFAEQYFNKEKYKSKKCNKKSDSEKDAEAEAYINSTGMESWLAKIVFKDQIDLIWASE